MKPRWTDGQCFGGMTIVLSLIVLYLMAERLIHRGKLRQAEEYGERMRKLAMRNEEELNYYRWLRDE